MKRPVEFQLAARRESFEASGNPIYAWKAIFLCVHAEMPIPPWLAAYLFQCSKRMLSDKAQQRSDLRAILPWVLGFPPKKKSGPGKLLNPYNFSLNRVLFLKEFAVRILEGEDPAAARRNACNVAFRGEDADVDDKTLRRWLRDGYGLKEAPENSEQWKKIAYVFLAVMSVTDQLSKMNMTSAEADAILNHALAKP
jgi:hypothetical protein